MSPHIKANRYPGYHARETAVQRAAIEGAGVVLGSATPSMEAMYRAKRGEYVLLELKNRSRRQQMAEGKRGGPEKGNEEGNRSILSRRLQDRMEDRLKRGEQVMLFLNRRGYSGFVSCRECGSCDPLSALQRVSFCPPRRKDDVSLLWVYTAYGFRVPGVRVASYRRIPGRNTADRRHCKTALPGSESTPDGHGYDTQKDSYEKILSAFANEEADVLVGTQMIVKGHDFPNVTLVGVLAADMSLYTDDYRSGKNISASDTGSRPGRPGREAGRSCNTDLQPGALCGRDRGGSGL